MKIDFQREYIGRFNAYIDKFTGYFPIIFLFCNDDAEVIHFDVGGNGSIREIPDSVEDYCDKYVYTPMYLSDISKEQIEKGATHLISGYYDIFKKEFIQLSDVKIEANSKGKIESNIIKEVANLVFPIAHNASFLSRELMDMNIRTSSNHSLFQMNSYSEKMDLSHIQLDEIYHEVRKIYDNQDHSEFSYIEKDISREDLDKINIDNLAILSIKDQEALEKKFSMPKNGFIIAANILRVYNILELIIYKKSDDCPVDDYTMFHKFDPKDVMDNSGDYYIAIGFSKRFVETHDSIT